MRWYVSKHDRRFYSGELIGQQVVGVIIAPDDISREEIQEVMDRGGWELVRPYWDHHRWEIYTLLSWEEATKDRWSHRDIITGDSHGVVWSVRGHRPFLVLHWDEIVWRVVAEPATLQEIDRIACRKGSFRNAKRIAELVKLLQEE
jgi:hypothetical protein